MAFEKKYSYLCVIQGITPFTHGTHYAQKLLVSFCVFILHAIGVNRVKGQYRTLN